MPFDGTSLNEVAAHLLRAKRYIEEHGWGGPKNLVGARCLLGVIWYACYERAISHRPVSLVFARAVGLSSDLDVPRWNDDRCRSLADVLAGFDAAIALAMAEERVNGAD